MMAMADNNRMEMAVAIGKGDHDGDGNGQWRQQQQLPMVVETAMATAMAMVTATATTMATAKAMATVTAMATAMAMVRVTATATAKAMETAMAILMVMATGLATMTKGGLPLHVPSMCSAVAGVTLCLYPHGHKGVCIHQRCIMGVMLQRVFAPFQGGEFLTAHYGLFFYFLQLLFSLLNNPLFVSYIIQVLKNPVSPLTLYLLHSYFIFLQR